MAYTLSNDIKSLINIEKNKIEEKEKELFGDVTTICPFCQQPTEGDDILHKECINPYEDYLGLIETLSDSKCTCGCKIRSREYRCPVCFSVQDYGVSAPFHINNINQKFKQIKEREVSQKRKIIINKFFSNNPQYTKSDHNQGEKKNKNRLEKEKTDIISEIDNLTAQMNHIKKLIGQANINNKEIHLYSKTEISQALGMAGFLTILTFFCILVVKSRSILAGPATWLAVGSGFFAGVSWIIFVFFLIKNIINTTSTINNQNKNENDKKQLYAAYENIAAKQSNLQNQVSEIEKQISEIEKKITDPARKKQAIIDYITKMQVSINLRGIIAKIQEETLKGVSSYIEESGFSKDHILIKLTDFKSNRISYDEFINTAKTQLSFLPKIEIDSFLDGITHESLNSQYMNYVKAIRYYLRLKDIITGDVHIKENTAIKHFKNNFFNRVNFDYTNRSTDVSKADLTIFIQSFYSMVPPEIVFNDIPSDTSNLASQQERYVFEKSISLYYSELHNTKYSDMDLKEMALYISHIICDLIGYVYKISYENEESLRIMEEEERRREIEEQRDHERYIAEQYNEAARQNARMEEYKMNAARFEHDKEISALKNQNSNLINSLNQTNSKIDELTTDIKKMKTEEKNWHLSPRENAREREKAEIWRKELNKRR